MNDLAAQFAFDNSAMCEIVHEAEEGEGDEEGEEGGEVGRHTRLFFWQDHSTSFQAILNNLDHKIFALPAL